MGRTVLGVLAGLATMVVVIMLVQLLGAQLFPPPQGIDTRDPDALATVMAQMPLGALAFVVVAWLLGAFAGGWVAARISVQYPRVGAVIVALAVVAGVGLVAGDARQVDAERGAVDVAHQAAAVEAALR